MAKAEAADAADIPMAVDPDDWRGARSVAQIAEPPKIETRAKERHAREMAGIKPIRGARRQTAATGRSPAAAAAASNRGTSAERSDYLTDEDSRVMPVAGGGFEQCYNAQLPWRRGVCGGCCRCGSGPNDKHSSRRCWVRSVPCPKDWATPNAAGGHGLFSAANVETCEKAGIEPLIAMGRQPHHPPLAERFEQAPLAPENPTPVEAMAHRLKTPEGRKVYALRKQTPEPVFGIIKSAIGFRQFSLRGLDKARGEWSLVTMAWNIKRMSSSTPPDEAGRELAQGKSGRLPVIMGGHTGIRVRSSARRKPATAKSLSAFSRNASGHA